MFFSGILGRFRIGSSPVTISAPNINMLEVISDRLKSVFSGDIILDAPFSDGIVTKPEFSFDKSKTITKSPVVKVNNKSIVHNWYVSTCTKSAVYHYNDYVYNLSVEDDETYIANGMLVHNCRSTMVPALDSRFDFLREGATRSARGPEGVEQVSARETYYSWIKKQDVEFQESAIGEKWAKLLNDGGLSSGRFAELRLNKDFAPITLKKLAELEPIALRKAGMMLNDAGNVVFSR
jgi:hypothetical protein